MRCLQLSDPAAARASSQLRPPALESAFLAGPVGASGQSARAAECSYLFKAFSRYSWIHFSFGSMHTCLLLFFSLALWRQRGLDVRGARGGLGRGDPGV